MVSLQRSELINEYVGNSTDEFPMDGVPNGSLFYEMDTGNKYIFDDEHNAWRDTLGNGHDIINGSVARNQEHTNIVYPPEAQDGD